LHFFTENNKGNSDTGLLFSISINYNL